jgi:acyl carrier protein
MTQDDFLVLLQKEIQRESALHVNDLLEDIPEWDSMAMLVALNVFDEIGVEIDIDDLEKCKSIKDILQKAGFDA